MKVIPIAVKNSLEAGVARISICWSITRADGQVFRFTDCDHDLVVGGHTYRTDAGIVPSATEGSTTMSVDNLEMMGITNDTSFQQAQLDAGAFDAALVDVFAVDRDNLAAGAMHIQAGTLGEVRLEKGQFKAEVRGLLQNYSQSIVEVIAKTCGASLGDARCKKDLTSYRHETTISAVDNNRVLTQPLVGFEDDYFAYGKATFLTGAAAGLSMEVKASYADKVELLLPLALPIQPGDQVRLEAGCNRERDTCVSRFNNIANFRGFPDLPDETVMKPGGSQTRDSGESSSK